MGNFHRYRDAVFHEHPSAAAAFHEPLVDVCRSVTSIHDLKNLSETLHRLSMTQSQTSVMIDDFRRIFVRCETGYRGSVLRDLKFFGHLLFDMRSLRYLNSLTKRELTDLLNVQGPIQFTFR